MDDPQHLEALSRALYQRIWMNDQDITTPSSLAQACIDANISEDETSRLLDRINDKDVKQNLIEVTNGAVELGVFGAPTIIKDGTDLYFGSDRFQVIASELGLPWHGPQQSPRRLTKSSL